MFDILIKALSVFAVFGLGCVLGAIFLPPIGLRFQGKWRTVDAQSVWDSHAVLNAINRTALALETRQAVNLDLLYQVGDHLKASTILQQGHGWLDARQLEEWLIAIIGLHQQLHNEPTAATVSIKMSTALHKIRVTALTGAFIQLLQKELSVQHVSVSALSDPRRRYGFISMQTPVSVVVKLRPSGMAPSEVLPHGTPWQITPETLALDITLPWKYK